MDDLIGGWAGFSALGRRPTPLYKFPPMLRDRHFIRSLGWLALHDGYKDLLIAGEVVIGNAACQNLVVVPVNHRPSRNKSVYAGHIPAA